MKPWIGLAVALLAGCGSGFRYEKASTDVHAATQNVAWLIAEPSQPYSVVARFRGTETALCPAGRPYCSLYAQAMLEGADAIWLQRRETWTRQEEWVMIRGEMKRIPSQEYETVEGVFIRLR